MNGYRKFSTDNVTISVSSGEYGWVRLSLVHAGVAAVSVDVTHVMADAISNALRQSADRAGTWQAEVAAMVERERELQGGAQ